MEDLIEVVRISSDEVDSKQVQSVLEKSGNETKSSKKSFWKMLTGGGSGGSKKKEAK